MDGSLFNRIHRAVVLGGIEWFSKIVTFSFFLLDFELFQIVSCHSTESAVFVFLTL